VAGSKGFGWKDCGMIPSAFCRSIRLARMMS
jgi:hypothetical protein